MTKLFLTGATGYIGGEVLYTINNAHPEYEITALVRNPEKGAKVASQYPKVRLVYGDLDSYDLIKEESARADIVVHLANCDHEGSARAIVDGLSQHTAEKPGFYIHTSGTGILSYNTIKNDLFGDADEKVFDDWDNVSELVSLPDKAWHRNVDIIVLDGAKKHASVKTAIVCPPTIYGPGRGPANQTSDQWPGMVKGILQRGRGFKVGKGKNLWTYVHVQDLSNVYLLLAEAASEGGGNATWDEEGYYLAENGEFVWGDMAQEITNECKKQNLIETSELDSLSKDEAEEVMTAGSAKWGTNSRGRALRANKLLGWKSVHPSPLEELPGLVTSEAKKLGLIKGHAEVAAGNA